MDIEEKIERANTRLKSAQVGCSIAKIGNRLYLVATLPPKPDSSRIKPYQQRIALSIYANHEGLRLAEREARKVGALAACREFSWTPYLKETQGSLTLVKDWVDRFEADYFTRRKRSPKSETTWTGDYLKVFKQLPQDQALTAELLKEIIVGTTPDTRTRRRFCIAAGALAKFAGITFDPKPYVGRYSPRRVTPRDLPDDKQIAQCFYKIHKSDWQWAYGMLATYGLRPHELFWIDFNNLNNASSIVTLLDGKTGPRRVWPIFPEWVEEFNLNQPALPEITGKSNSDYGDRVTQAFRRFEIPFRPYDLRHCWAIRSLEFGLDISLAAQQMGHSVSVHTDLYHLWISDRHQQRAFDALMMRSDRPKAPSIIDKASLARVSLLDD